MYAGKTDILYLETGHSTLEFLRNLSYPIRDLILKRYDTVEFFIKIYRETLQNAGRQTLISTEILYRFLIDKSEDASESTETNSEEQIQLLRALVLALNHLHERTHIAFWIRLNERVDHDHRF